MEQDLRAYFEKDMPSTENIRVQYKLLRNGPTQTGVTYPKYYVWATISSNDRIISEGAARIVAVDGTQFVVTDFVSKNQITSDPGKVQNIFPPALISNILALAGEK